jgi:hypothetical protein
VVTGSHTSLPYRLDVLGVESERCVGQLDADVGVGAGAGVSVSVGVAVAFRPEQNTLVRWDAATTAARPRRPTTAPESQGCANMYCFVPHLRSYLRM